jgi:diadenosine tetraphosphatase ApaH/serine/threonine PP2A family protein phosphatase
VFLLRGSHDDPRASKIFGFGEECTQRLSENISSQNSVFKAICDVFEMLPLAAVLDERVLCLHGGFSRELRNIYSIDDVVRPVTLSKKERLVADLLWGEPGEGQLEPESDPLGLGASRFSEKQLRTLLYENELDILIRGKDVVSGGFEVNASNEMAGLSSCTSYGGRAANSGCCLKITKNSEFVPLMVTGVKDDKMWMGDRSSLVLSEEEQQMRSRAFLRR